MKFLNMLFEYKLQIIIFSVSIFMIYTIFRNMFYPRKKTTEEIISDFDDKFSYIGRIFHNQKYAIIHGPKKCYENALKQDEFIFAYDKYNRIKYIGISSEEFMTNIYTVYRDNTDESYVYDSGNWDEYVIKAMNKLYERAIEKEKNDENELNEQIKLTNNYFNELFAKKD